MIYIFDLFFVLLLYECLTVVKQAELRLISENPDYDYATDIPDYDEDFDQVQTEDLMQVANIHLFWMFN